MRICLHGQPQNSGKELIQAAHISGFSVALLCSLTRHGPVRKDLIEHEGRESGAAQAEAHMYPRCGIYQLCLLGVDTAQQGAGVTLLPALRGAAGRQGVGGGV